MRGGLFPHFSRTQPKLPSLRFYSNMATISNTENLRHGAFIINEGGFSISSPILIPFRVRDSWLLGRCKGRVSSHQSASLGGFNLPSPSSFSFRLLTHSLLGILMPTWKRTAIMRLWRDSLKIRSAVALLFRLINRSESARVVGSLVHSLWRIATAVVLVWSKSQ